MISRHISGSIDTTLEAANSVLPCICLIILLQSTAESDVCYYLMSVASYVHHDTLSGDDVNRTTLRPATPQTLESC